MYARNEILHQGLSRPITIKLVFHLVFSKTAFAKKSLQKQKKKNIKK